MPGPYSISVRATGIITRPLSILSFPSHPLSRFQWVNLPPYVSPDWYPGKPGTANAMANQGKTLAGRNIRAPQRRA